MVKLFCAIVGEGSAFEVNIDNTESVSALQKVISAALRYRGRPDLLQLFLAKTEENGWMTYDEDLANKLLQNRVDTSKLKALWPTWKLNRAKDPQLFGKDLLLGEDVVHVLVRLPKEQSVPSRTRVHSEIEDQKSMKRLKTSEVDKWKWKEEEPMYSRNRRLFFVNREKAVRDLIEYHKENFIRARDGSGGEWVIPLLDSMFGIGKSAFGQEYIRRCQSLKPDTTADEFMTTLCSCHTIRITLSQEHVLDKNGDFDSYLASLSLVECLRDFFEANYDVLPHTFDSREEDYVEILEDLTEEVGPLFIVFDDIGLAFEHDKLDDVAKREQFFEFCTMLQPLFENRKLFFLIAGTASFLDYFTTYTTFNIPFEFEQLDLHPLGRDSIKTIIKKTRWDRTKSESIQDQLQLTEEQVTLAADHLLDTTFGHPRSLQLALERCESYDDLLTYTTKRDTVESCLETMDVKM